MTVPDATPASITSPTPYWSSRIMNTPERKSVTRFRAPKPTATPATPALASSGARLMSSTDSTVSAAVPMITNEATLRSTEPIASLRCRRRSALTSSPPSALVWPLVAWRFIRAMSCVIMRRTTARSTTAIAVISRICSAEPSQDCQLFSTQPAASAAVFWAWSTTAGSAAAIMDQDRSTAQPFPLRPAHRRGAGQPTTLTGATCATPSMFGSGRRPPGRDRSGIRGCKEACGKTL